MTGEQRATTGPCGAAAGHAYAAAPSPYRAEGDRSASKTPRRQTDWVVRVLRHSGAPIQFTRPIAALARSVPFVAAGPVVPRWLALFAVQLVASAGAAAGWLWVGGPTFTLPFASSAVAAATPGSTASADAGPTSTTVTNEHASAGAALRGSTLASAAQTSPREARPTATGADTSDAVRGDSADADVDANAEADTDTDARGVDQAQTAEPQRSSAAGAPDELDEDAIVAGVKAQVSAVAPCLRTAVRRGVLQRNTPYRLVLDWTIEPSGAVTATHVEAPPTLAGSALPICLASAMQGWRFPPSQHGAVVHNYPFGPFTMH